MRQTKRCRRNMRLTGGRNSRFRTAERQNVEFMFKKVAWRYAKGHLDSGSGHIYLGDCRHHSWRLWEKPPRMKANPLTSPPYYGVTDYFYDQCGCVYDIGCSVAERPHVMKPSATKFSNKKHYTSILFNVFAKSKSF